MLLKVLWKCNTSIWPSIILRSSVTTGSLQKWTDIMGHFSKRSRPVRMSSKGLGASRMETVLDGDRSITLRSPLRAWVFNE